MQLHLHSEALFKEALVDIEESIRISDKINNLLYAEEKVIMDGSPERLQVRIDRVSLVL